MLEQATVRVLDDGVIQDRLVKALRLRGISDLEGANLYLEQEFLRELNGHF
jgi:hypothetical protein